MSARKDPLDSLDDFPTPPWATRALAEFVLPALGLTIEQKIVWEPAAGRRIMADVLNECTGAWASVFTSDVHLYEGHETEMYPKGLDAIGSFVGAGLDAIEWPHAKGPAWVITNPPFNLGLEFALRGLAEAREGVALLCRSNWAEGIERYERLFAKHPPLAEAQFVERVPMTEGGYWWAENDNGERVRKKAHRGGYDPAASTATAYSWFVWANSQDLAEASRKAICGTRKLWIPPCRERLTMPDDARRFGKIRRAP
jgi:hypothetical protein